MFVKFQDYESRSPIKNRMSTVLYAWGSVFTWLSLLFLRCLAFLCNFKLQEKWRFIWIYASRPTGELTTSGNTKRFRIGNRRTPFCHFRLFCFVCAFFVSILFSSFPWRFLSVFVIVMTRLINVSSFYKLTLHLIFLQFFRGRYLSF